MSQVDWKRIGRLAWVLVKITLGAFVLLMVPDLLRFFPYSARPFCDQALAALVFLLAYEIGRRRSAAGPEGGSAAVRARRVLARVDAWIDWAFQRGLAIALFGICVFLLAGWVPHYLTWPLSRDEDTYALLALSWDHGIMPYRDIRAFNFPGVTYLFWALGKVFGWGRTVPFYAFDAACVVLLGWVLIVWSRRRLGGAVPGLIGYLAFLNFYLNLMFEGTGQRDWHSALLVAAGIMILQAAPGRWPRLISALTTAMALVIRPHAVLLMPALVAAVMERDDPSGSGWRGRVRNAIGWCLCLSLFLAIAFAPLVLAGIAADFVRGVQIALYGGPYHKTTSADTLEVFVDQFKHWRYDVPLAVTFLLAARPKGRLSGVARPWCLAWLGVLVYRPLHPMHHGYLVIPIEVVAAVTWAFPVSWLLSSRWVARRVLVLAVMILACRILPGTPYMCSLTNSFHALQTLALGEMPDRPPLGTLMAFGRPEHELRRPNRWDDYCSLLRYLRTTTSPRTTVASVLTHYPYEAINGPTGRLSPFLAESGICWMLVVNMDVDAEFAEALERTEDSVVVWKPHRSGNEPSMRYERVHAVIRKYYEPAAQFGQFEVWSRKRVVRGP
jgi:hypothetical protein